MRFAMVCTFYPPYSFGGDAVFVRRLAESLAGRGHEVHVVHCLDAYRLASGGSVEPPPPEPPGVIVHRLESRWGPLSPLLTQQTGRPVLKAGPIREVLGGTDFDVIHFHNPSLVGGPGVLGYGSAVKLYTLHEHWLVCPLHVLFRHGREPCFEKQCLRCTLKAGRPPQLWRAGGLIRRSLRHVDACIAPSRAVAKRHRAEGITEVEMIHLPYFVPDPRDEPPPPEPPRRLPSEPFLLFVGRLERLKGLHTVIPAIRKHPRLKLVVAGTGADRDHLRDLAGGCPRIHFLGWLDHAELAATYARAAAVVLPSLAFEVLPLVMLEAAASGTPSIVRDLGAPGEVVADTACGVSYSTTEELIEHAERLTSDPDERRRAGRAAREAFEERWTEEAHAERYLSVVERFLARRRGSATSPTARPLGPPPPRSGGAGIRPPASEVTPGRAVPRPWPLVGHLPHFLRDKLGFLERCARDPREAVPLALRGPTYLLKNPDDVGYVLEDGADAFEKSAHFTTPAGRSVLGRGLHTASTQDHRTLRREMQPLFSRRALDAHTDVVHAAVDDRLDAWTDTVELAREMFEMTLDALGRILFGAEWRPALRQALVDRRRYVHFWIRSPIPGLARLPLPFVRRHHRAVRLLRETVEDRVRRCRSGEGTDATDMLTFLSVLRDSNERPLSVRRIQDEVVTLGITGFETVASALTWTLHLLGTHPRIRERLDREVTSVCGRSAPSVEDVGHLVFTGRVIQESLRLYPPTWIFLRVATRDVVLPSGAPVRRGAKIYICPWILGRQARFFPDPETFDPDRFTPERASGCPRLAHVPFGAGARICIGRPLALRESTMILARISQRFHLTPEDPHPPEPVPGVVLDPRGPVRATVRARTDVAGGRPHTTGA